MRRKNINLIVRQALDRQFVPNHVQTFTLHQGLGLGQEVGHQFPVMITDRVQALRKADEITGNHGVPLVQELEERMLPVGAGLTPYHRPSTVLDPIAVPVSHLTTAFHVDLLKMRRKAMKVLVIRQECVRGRAEKIPIPNTNQRQGNRQVGLQRGFPEMPIHPMGAFKQGLEPRKTHGYRNR